MSEENKSEEVSGSLSGNLNAPQTIEEKKRTLRIAKCLQGEPVCVLNERQAPQPQPKWYAEIEKWAGAIFDSWGNKAINPELGEIELTHRSIKDSNAHKLNPFKAEAYRSIKDVIEQGVVFAQTKVGKEEHYFIAAPVTIDNQIDLVSVLVQKNLETQTMYLHSVMIREKILEKDFEQKNTLGYPSSVADTLKNEPEPQGKLYPRDTGRILQKFLKVNIHQLEIELNQQIEQVKGNKMDEMKKQTVSGNLNDAVSWFDTQEQFQWSNGATNYYKQEAQFIVDTVTKYPHRDGEPFVAISGSEYPALYPLNDKLDKVSIQAAEMILVKLDGQMDGYYKTNVEVFNHSGELLAERRYDLVDRNGGLFNLLVEDERQIDNAVYLSQYLPQDEKMNLLDRIDKQMEVDNNYAMRYPEVKEARMATMSNRGAFFERLQQQILQQDKTVEQHLSEMVDEVVAIANRQNVEQRQPENEVSALSQNMPFEEKVFQYMQLKAAIRENERQSSEIWGAAEFADELKSLQEKNRELISQQNQMDKADNRLWQVADYIERQHIDEKITLKEVQEYLSGSQTIAKTPESLSGNLKAESTPLDALQALGKVEFITPALNKEQDALNETLQGLTAEQRKAVEPLYKQLEASHELRQMYQEYGDTIGVEDIEKHINRIEWAFRNKVKAFNEPQVDYSDMNYYKGVENTINKMREENEQRQPETISGSPEPKTETQPQVDEPKNFVQNFIENQLNAQNSQEVVTDSNISDAKTFQEKVMFARVAETEISKMIDDIAKQRLYLAVDFDNKDTAKAAGAKWDKALKGWYAEKGNLNDELQAFLPQQPVTTVENRKPYSDLMAEAQKIGVELNSVNFKEDFHGWVRCPVKGKGKSNRDGGYKLFRNDDGSIGATVKNYSSGDSVNWCDKTFGDREVKSKVPLPDFVANKKQEEWNEVAKNTVEHDIQQMRSKIAEQAYHALQPALSTDPYIQNKGIVDIGKLRRLDDGSTIVPLYHNGKIANLQMIPSYNSSEKRLMTQAVKTGAYYSIGNGKNPQTVIIAEGMATADSVHQIASEIYGKDKVLTLAAIDSGNLKAVADKVDKVYPDAQKLIAADNDLGNEIKAQQRGVDNAETHKYNAGFKYANQIIEAYPHFKAIPAPAFDGKNTDWNDVLTAKGFDTSIKLFQECVDRQPARLHNNVKQQAATPQTTPQRKNGTDGREY